MKEHDNALKIGVFASIGCHLDARRVCSYSTRGDGFIVSCGVPDAVFAGFDMEAGKEEWNGTVS